MENANGPQPGPSGAQGQGQNVMGLGAELPMPSAPQPGQNENPDGLKEWYEFSPTKDFVIIASDGIEVSCHYSVLQVTAPNFCARFPPLRSGMQRRLHLPITMDIEGRCVDAFFRYLYYQDTSQISQNFHVAVCVIQLAMFMGSGNTLCNVCDIMKTVADVSYLNVITLKRFRNFCSSLNNDNRKRSVLDALTACEDIMSRFFMVDPFGPNMYDFLTLLLGRNDTIQKIVYYYICAPTWVSPWNYMWEDVQMPPAYFF